MNSKNQRAGAETRAPKCNSSPRVIELNQLNQVVTEEYRARKESTDAKDARVGRKSADARI